MAIRSTFLSQSVYSIVFSARFTLMICGALGASILYHTAVGLPPADDPLKNSPPSPDPEAGQAVRASAAPPLIAGILATNPASSTPEARAVVWAFLRQAWNYDPAMEAEWLLGVDEALSWLEAAAGCPDRTNGSEEVSIGLAGLVADSGLPEAERECAILHLGAFNRHKPCEPQGLQVLAGVLQEDLSRPLCGAALRAIDQISTDDAQLCALVRERALTIAANPAAHVRNRIAVFELVSANGWVEFEPVVCERLCIAQRVAERVAAFEALARIGTGDTLRLLEALPTERDAVCAAAREVTLQRLRSLSACPKCGELNPD